MIQTNLHFIWLSKDFMAEDNRFTPDKAKVVDTYRHHNPEFTILLWNNERTREFINKKLSPHDDIYKKIFDPDTRFVQKIDIIRMLILQEYGGIYADLDTICVGGFLKLLMQYKFFVGQEKAQKISHMHDEYQVASDMHYIQNAVIGSVKNHKIFEIYFDRLLKVENKYRISYGPNLVEDALYHFRELSGPLADEGVKVLPAEYFYPFAYFEDVDITKMTANTVVVHFYGGTGKDD